MIKGICLFFACMFLFLIGKSQVDIENQAWTSQNLSTNFYRNGDPIPKVEDAITWKNLTTGAWCWYNNDSVHYWQYGKLYNWYAVNDPRGLAPVGWHVASNAEWNHLVKYLDTNSDTTCSICSQSTSAGGAMKEAGTIHWLSPNTGATNSSGFKALPGGYRGINGGFGFANNLGYWWSSEEADMLNAWGRLLSSDAAVVFRSYYDKVDGFSVRLVKDNTTVPVTLLDFSGYAKAGRNVLHWSTASEMNTSRYEIEKCNGRTSFAVIGTVTAASNSAVVQNYTYTDDQPGPAVNYYRLRMTDVDGGYAYSWVVAVSNKKMEFNYAIFPNPVHDLLQIQRRNILQQDAQVWLTAMNGQVVAKKDFFKGTSVCNLETALLCQGEYILTIESKGVRENFRVMVSR